MSEPKPCPFCGEMPELFTNPCYYYQCVKSGCEGQEVSWNDTEEEALKSWNARPIEDALRAEIAELKKDKPILCAECNDHILPNDEAICWACADTKKSIITELMAENESIKSQALVWHKYPDEKPEPNGYMNRVLLVAYKTDKITAVATCEYFFPMFGIECDEFGFGKLENGIVITHWAYLPEAPKEEK